MSIFELIDGLLTTLDVPYYEGQPEFEAEPPSAFISYNVYDVPAFFGCGKELATTYYVTINIYTSGADKATVADNLSTALTALFTENGFIRQSGNYGLSDDFPKYYHRIIEFNYSREL